MIETAVTKQIYAGDGQTQEFPFYFPFNDSTDVRVAIYDIETEQETVLVSDYYVDTVAKKVIYPGYPPGEAPAMSERPPVLPTGKRLVVYRSTPVNQLEDLGDKYPLPVVEGMVDKNTMILQEANEKLSRAILVDMGGGLTPQDVVYDIKHLKEYKETAENSAANAAQSEANAAESATAAANSATAAQTSATTAATIAANAHSSETNAAESARQAAVSAGQASTSAATATAAVSTVATDANRAAASATSAAASAAAALASENSADDAAQAAATSAGAAAASEAATSQLAQTAAAAITQAVAASVGAAADSAAAARVSAAQAATSESNALASATSAQVNATAAANSAIVAAEHETSVVESARLAQASATAASASELNALSAAAQTYTQMEAAQASAQAAAASATTATAQANRAGQYANAAQASAEDAEESTTEAKRLAKITMDKVAEAAVGYPAQTGRITYDGTQKTPTWDIFYEPLKMDVTGTTSATDAGTYTVTFTPKSGFYWWEDDTTAGKSQTWTIDRQPLAATPSQVGALTYNAQEQSPSWRDYDATKLTMGGTTAATEEGEYTTTFTPTANYCWEDGTTTARSVTWRIYALSVDIPTVTDKIKTYNRTAQSPTISEYNPLLIEVTGNTATDAGSYLVTMHLRSASIRWDDTTTADKVVPWSIQRKAVTIPTVSDTAKVYDGTAQSPTVSEFDSNEIVLGGNVQETDAGSYTLTMTLTSTANYLWTDETTGVKERAWSIARKSVTAPQLTNTEKTYDGTEQAPTILPYDTDAIIVGGDTAATTAGTKTITFTLASANYIWSDETTGQKTATWVILPMSVAIPTLTNTSFTYDGTEKAPTITYDHDWVTVGGVTAATNAGTQTVTFTLVNASLKWSDETTGQKTGTWSIAKAAGSVTLSKSTISLNTSQLTDTFTVTRTGDGAISVTSSDSTIATATISGTTVTVTAVATGNVTVTVSVAEGTNWLAATDATTSVAVQLFPATLNDADWDLISQEAIAGTADLHWDIGDVKMIQLGDFNNADLNNHDHNLGVFILDFNHPMNGVAENNIIFGCFKTSVTNGVDVLIRSKSYGKTPASGSVCFNMNHAYQKTNGQQDGYYGTTYGGWKGSDLRYDILGATSTKPSQHKNLKSSSNVGYNATENTLLDPHSGTFLAALPSDLRSKIRLWSRWVDAVGGYGTTDAAVSESRIQETVDAVTLLCSTEVFASPSSAITNVSEANHNTRMAYYTNGNSTIKYVLQYPTSKESWFLCSTGGTSGSNYFATVGLNSDNEEGRTTGNGLAGLAPAFKV